MSELQTIKDEILRRFKRPRTTVDDIPGYAGGNLGEQLDREGQSPDRMSGVRSTNVFAPPQPQPSEPTGQVLTSTNQANITRPRSVFAPPPADPNAPFGASGQPFSPTRDRRTQPRDYVADDSQYLNDLESKPDTLKDKVVGGLRAVNQAFGSNPNIFTPTKKEREILKAQGMLGRDIAIQREQTQQQLAQMVPIYDTAGNMIGTAPRRTAVSNQIRATDTGTRATERADANTERKRVNDARIKNYDSMGERRAHTELTADWKNGMYDNDPDMLEYVGKKMGMSGPAPQSNQGQLVTDEKGNFKIVRKGAATATTVTDKDTGKPTQSWVITQQDRQDKRARASQKAMMDRTLAGIGAVNARLGNPDDYDTIAGEATANAKAARDQAAGLPPNSPAARQYRQEALAHDKQAAQARMAASKARSGQSGAGKISPREDPQIRDYANKHFSGNYQKALEYARQTGYQK